MKINIKDINDTVRDATELTMDIAREIKELSFIIGHLPETYQEYDSDKRKNNPYIVKRVIKHLAEGLSLNDSCCMTANELGETLARVEGVFDYHKCFATGLRLYSRKYAIDKLYAAGFTGAQIAKVIGISTPHVYKILKAEVIMNFAGGYYKNPPKICG